MSLRSPSFLLGQIELRFGLPLRLRLSLTGADLAEDHEVAGQAGIGRKLPILVVKTIRAEVLQSQLHVQDRWRSGILQRLQDCLLLLLGMDRQLQ